MPELWVPNEPLVDLEADLLDSCLKEENRIFASTDSANNHLDAGFEEVPEHLRPRIVSGLGNLVVAHGVVADFIAPVPNGANGWGYALSDALSYKPTVLTFEKLDRRLFANTSDTNTTLAELESTPTVIVVDDVTNDGGTSEAMADFLVAQGFEVVFVLSILFRGKLQRLNSSTYNRGVLLPREIPLKLDWPARRATGEIKSLKTSA